MCNDCVDRDAVFDKRCTPNGTFGNKSRRLVPVFLIFESGFGAKLKRARQKCAEKKSGARWMSFAWPSQRLGRCPVGREQRARIPRARTSMSASDLIWQRISIPARVEEQFFLGYASKTRGRTVKDIIGPIETNGDPTMSRTVGALLSTKETCKKVSCHRSTLHRWIKQGRFPRPIKAGNRKNLWDPADLDQWIEDRKAER